MKHSLKDTEKIIFALESCVTLQEILFVFQQLFQIATKDSIMS